MAVSIRQKHLARRAALMQKPVTQEYEILDPHHNPDLKGEFGAAKVYRRGAKQYVRLTDPQAKFYLDQGGIAPVSTDTTTA